MFKKDLITVFLKSRPFFLKYYYFDLKNDLHNTSIAKSTTYHF